MQKIINFKAQVFILAVFMLGCFFVSCSDSDSEISSETIQNYIDQSIYSIQAESNVGKLGCFEFIFPITIEYPEGTTVTVEDYDMLRTELKEWVNNNQDLFEDEDEDEDEGKEGRGEKYGYKGDVDWSLLPSLVFPIEVVADDGTVSSITDQMELFQLKRSCAKDFYGGKGRHGHNKGDKCFKLVFPITLDLPDGSTITGADRADLKMQLREWKANNDGEEKPTLNYPVIVELEDGTTQEVASVEDFKALKETCSNAD